MADELVTSATFTATATPVEFVSDVWRVSVRLGTVEVLSVRSRTKDKQQAENEALDQLASRLWLSLHPDE